MDRRAMLHRLGLAAIPGLTGCAGLRDNDPQGTLTIVLINQRMHPLEAIATITNQEGTRVKTYSLGPLEHRSRRSVTWTAETSGPYIIRVEGEGAEWSTQTHWYPQYCPEATNKTTIVPGEAILDGRCPATETP
jgi:hypothetical protein